MSEIADAAFRCPAIALEKGDKRSSGSTATESISTDLRSSGSATRSRPTRSLRSVRAPPATRPLSGGSGRADGGGPRGSQRHTGDA